MKKSYQKPALFAESFQLVEHIADGCKIGDGAGANMGDPSVCVYTSGNISLFTNDCNLGSWMDLDDEDVSVNNPSSWPIPMCENSFIDSIGNAFHS